MRFGERLEGVLCAETLEVVHEGHRVRGRGCWSIRHRSVDVHPGGDRVPPDRSGLSGSERGQHGRVGVELSRRDDQAAGEAE
jgi:hypothetical protein